MKKLLHTTLIALLISTVVFAQRANPPGQQVAPSQTTVIVMGAHGNNIILLSPADGKLFEKSDASKPVLFRWTAVTPKPKEAVTYRLKVWQLRQGQTVVEAMRINQPVITKEVTNITQAAIGNLYTGPCKPPYLCDFVWAVEAFNNEETAASKIYGNSENYSFKFEVDDNAVRGVATANNKGNAGNTGMPTGKVEMELDKDSYSAGKNNCCLNPCCSENAVWIDEAEIQSGIKSSKEAQSKPAALYLPIEKIMYDTDGSITGVKIKTEKGESGFVKVVVAGSNGISGGYCMLKTEKGEPVIAKVVVAGSNSLSPGVK